MVKFKFANLFVILLLIATTFAQQNMKTQNRYRNQTQKRYGTVFGKVVSLSTQEALPGANIIVEGTNLGAATGLDGGYLITGIPAGEYTLRATMIGYESQKEILVVPDRSKQNLDFFLRESIIQMNEIVVTGSGMPQLYEDRTVKTTVVNRKMIDSRKANNLADAIDFQTGVRVENNCQNCNCTQVRLLGLEGHHSQILIDGNPVLSSLANVYGLEQLPQEMIERVEIVKGGGSSLYGGQAIAGVINLISRRPNENNIRFDYNSGLLSSSSDHRVGLTLSRINKSASIKSIFFGTAYHRNPYDHNNDSLSEQGRIQSKAVGSNLFFLPGDRSEISLQLHFIQEDRRGGNKFNLPPHQADIAEWTDMKRYSASLWWTHKPTPLLDYKAYASVALTNRDSYYGAQQNPNSYGNTNNLLLVGGMQINYLWNRHAMIGGFQFNRDGIKDKAPAYHRIVDEHYVGFGLFVQDSFYPDKNRNTELLYGVRFDKHSAISSIITSPRLVFKSKLSNAVIFRSGYSTGFKAPQVFNEDLHITQVSGEGQVIRNSDDLEEEHGHSYYSGLEYQEIIADIGIKVACTGFYTRLTDTFLLTELDDPNTNEKEFYRINGAGLRVQGVEAEFGARMKNANFTAGITIQSSRFQEKEPDFGSERIFRTPDVYGSINFQYELTNYLNIMAIAKYTGPMIVPHYAGYIEHNRLEKTKAFSTIDLIAAYDKPLLRGIVVTISMGAYNILNDFQRDFDYGLYRDAGYVYGPLVPRRFIIGLAIANKP